MQRAASYPSVQAQPSIVAIAGSLLLVSLSYVLLLAAPAVTRHFSSLVLGKAGLQALESWLPVACGAGVVLGGASALVFVLTQVTREAQRRPYVALAPVLATFAACVLIGLRADLPLPGVSSAHVAVFAMALAVVGGALVQLPGMGTQLMGMACTFMPPVSLFGVLWVMSGNSDPAHAIWALTPGTRAFLGMLTMSSFAIGAVATLGRRAEAAAAETTLDVPVHATATYSYAQPAPVYAAQPRGYALQELEESYADDEALLARRGLPGWVMGLVAAAVIGASVLAIKVYMDRRAATAFLERASEPSRAIPSQASEPVAAPEAQPSVAAELPSAAPAVAAPVAAAAPAEPHREKLAETVLSPRAEKSEEVRSEPRSSRTSRSRSHASRSSTPAKQAAAVPVAAKQEKEKAEARVEAKPAKAKPEPEDSASVALKAARAATKEEPKPVKEAKPAAAPAARGDESLDELMDNVLKPAKGGSKKPQQANDDPIYGL